MSLLVAVDPGLRRLGLAVFLDGHLVHAELIVNPVKKDRGPTAWWGMAEAAQAAFMRSPGFVAASLVYVVEVPQVYRGPKGKADPDDLIQLAGVGGAVGSILRPREAFGYYPREWKGQVPGDVFVERIRSRLTEDERGRVVKCAASYEHNILDGIGLGLHYLGRL